MGIFDLLKKFRVSFENVTQNSPLSSKSSRSISLSNGEIAFLEYISNHDTDITTFSKKYIYDYDLNYEKTVNNFIQNGYARIGTTEESLSLYTAQSLKEFLKLKGLPTSGKKDILIHRILSETTEHDSYFTKRVYILTDKGKDTINNHNEIQIDNLKNEILTTMTYIRSGQFDKLVPIYETNENCKNPLSIGYDKTNITKDASAINEYRVMGHDTDRELSMAILAIMFHRPYSSIKINMKNIGYDDISDSEMYTISSSICTLRNLNEFKDAGIEKYKISTCRDQRVCAKCARHDKKIYSVKTAMLCKNAPPFCDECRCIIMAEFDLEDEE